MGKGSSGGEELNKDRVSINIKQHNGKFYRQPFFDQIYFINQSCSIWSILNTKGFVFNLSTLSRSFKQEQKT